MLVVVRVRLLFLQDLLLETVDNLLDPELGLVSVLNLHEARVQELSIFLDLVLNIRELGGLFFEASARFLFITLHKLTDVGFVALNSCQQVIILLVVRNSLFSELFDDGLKLPLARMDMQFKCLRQRIETVTEGLLRVN